MKTGFQLCNLNLSKIQNESNILHFKLKMTHTGVITEFQKPNSNHQFFVQLEFQLKPIIYLQILKKIAIKKFPYKINIIPNCCKNIKNMHNKPYTWFILQKAQVFNLIVVSFYLMVRAVIRGRLESEFKLFPVKLGFISLSQVQPLTSFEFNKFFYKHFNKFSRLTSLSILNLVLREFFIYFILMNYYIFFNCNLKKKKKFPY